MSQETLVPNRWIGLDGHKHYLVAGGVDAQLTHVLGPQRVQLSRLDSWVRKTLTPLDSVALEMSTNSFDLHDEISPFVHSMILVHPPHVDLIARAQVKTDKKSAFTLARLHAVGLLSPVWVPSQEVRDHRALVSQRTKMVRLSTQAKNRLHAVLHRHHLPLPEVGGLFDSLNRDWWLSLNLSPIEHVRIQSDLDTLDFAQTQIARLEEAILFMAIQDERALFLIQLPGVGLITAITLLAAIGDEGRFPTAKHLVGYSGLGCRVHDSGLTHYSGRITRMSTPVRPGGAISVPRWSKPHTPLAVRTRTGRPNWRAWNLDWERTRPSSPSRASFSSPFGTCSTSVAPTASPIQRWSLASCSNTPTLWAVTIVLMARLPASLCVGNSTA